MPLRAPSPEISLVNLTVGYPGKVVIEEMNASLPAGKISVILGGSGGGKSTLLRHILGLAHPFAGRIVMDGHDLCSFSEDEFRHYRKHMGVLFQDGALLGSLTVGENLGLPLYEHTGVDDAIVEEVVRLKLRLVGLEETMHYYPRQLSGGMRKRAGLARALVLDPRILLCDEPTSGLDPITAAEMDQLILELKDTFDMTIVVVTHDLDSVKAIADHVLVLHAGRLLYEGDRDGLLSSDAPYIRQFLARQPDPGKRRLLIHASGDDLLARAQARHNPAKDIAWR